MARVVIAGATGTIGRALTQALARRGDEVLALSRRPERASGLDDAELIAWPEPKRAPPPRAALAGSDAIVNLLGEPIAQRWTAAAKREIHMAKGSRAFDYMVINDNLDQAVDEIIRIIHHKKAGI